MKAERRERGARRQEDALVCLPFGRLFPRGGTQQPGKGAASLCPLPHEAIPWNLGHHCVSMWCDDP